MEQTTRYLAGLCLKKGILLDKESFSLLSNFDSASLAEIIEKIIGFKEKFITKNFILNNFNKLQGLISDKRVIEKIKINFGLTLEISKEEIIEKEKHVQKDAGFNHLKVLYSHANKTKKITPADFTKYFRVRFMEMRNILQQRKELGGLTSINKINGQRQALSIIGMVYEKRVTKNKNIMLEVEDLTGRIKVLINKDKESVYEKAKAILVDDIIAIKGMGDQKILFVSDLFYPDAMINEKVFLDRDVSVAFTSDVHVGSNNFLENNFLKFIKWLNGEVGDEEQREEARKVKYLLVTGDTVDGVGIFPGQEELLNIKDMKMQYGRLAEFLSMIRKDVTIILCPGQHDCVRVAEPQPPVGKNYAGALYNLENVLLVSNPAVIEITGNNGRGFKILMYHGASMTSFVNEIEHLRISKAHGCPAKIVKEILKRRHLAPCHSFVTYIPYDDYDPLLIKEVPDLIATADFHKPDVDIYNNLLIVCSSCWQSITPFEEKVGNEPDPCKVPVLNLKTRKLKILDFSDEPLEVSQLSGISPINANLLEEKQEAQNEN